jgi:hypothetical protein
MLEIDLQEGFADDAVQITADGQEVFNQTGVSTDYAIGLAKKLQLDLPEKRVQIEVRVSSRRLTGSTEVNTDASGYLGVSVGEGEIVFQVQSEGFIYF